MKTLIRFGLMVVAVWLTFKLIPGLSVDGWIGPILVAVFIAFANAMVIPIIKLFTLPIRILTLGLFTLAINVLTIVGVMWFTETGDLGIASAGFGANLLGALTITVLSSLISFFVSD